MVRRAFLGVLAALCAAVGVPASAQPNPDFWVTNTSGRQINEIYVSPSTDTNWGEDWLREHVLPSGQRFPIRPRRDGTWYRATCCRPNLRLADSTVRNVVLSAPMAWSVAFGTGS
mgnify:CR=1 FL=1